jgi:hypothetical protein
MKTYKSIAITCLLLFAMIMEPSMMNAQVTFGIGVTVRDAPPPLPYYDQPPCPVDGYLWTPGYWAYGDEGYYWVPGVWVSPPQYGYLWTPSYWGYSGGYYGFHDGYWGPHIGYYGGVNYGYGYGGEGYYGGRWEGRRFRYNTAVVNVNTTVVHNTYEDRRVVVNNTQVNRTSYNGPGGVTTKPSKQEESAMREKHAQPTSEQTSHRQVASKDRNQFASVNKGRPARTAISKVGGQDLKPQGHQATTENPKRADQPSAGGVKKPTARSADPNKEASPMNQQQHTQPVQKPQATERTANPSNHPDGGQANKPVARPSNPKQEAQPMNQQQHTQPAQKPQATERTAKPANHSDAGQANKPSARPSNPKQEASPMNQQQQHAQPTAKPQAIERPSNHSEGGQGNKPASHQSPPKQEARPNNQQQHAQPMKQQQQHAQPSERPQAPRQSQENNQPHQGGEGHEKRN